MGGSTLLMVCAKAITDIESIRNTERTSFRINGIICTLPNRKGQQKEPDLPNSTSLSVLI
jgi:hypothetical protein